MEWIILLVSLFVLVFSGMWLAVALGITTFIALYFLADGAHIIIGSAIWDSIQIYGLVAVALFILMGQIVLQSGVGKRVYSSLLPLFDRVPGGLLHTNVASCAVFAATFGSSAATAAVVGSAALPELRSRKYDQSLSLGSIAAGGTLGIMIPPSGAFIIYGSLTETSVGGLLAAGILPGIMLALMFSSYIGVKCRLNPHLAPATAPVPLGTAIRKAFGLWPLLALIAFVLTPIFAGWTTATEAASWGVFGALILGKFYGKLEVAHLKDALKETAYVFTMLNFIVAGARILGVAAGLIGLPRQLVLYVTGLSVPGIAIIIGLVLMYLALGCLFDGISFMVMTLPFVFPIVQALGYDPIWFGVMMVLMIEAGQLTPPVGVNLYIVQAIAGKETTLGAVIRGVWPFFLLQVVAAAIVIAFPIVALAIPSILY